MVKVIEMEGAILRPYTLEDAMAVFSAVNSKSIMRNTTIPLPWTLDFAAWWISFIKDQEKKKPMPEFHFVIECDGEFAGTLGVINIDEHRKGEIGYWMVDRFAGRGLMTQAVKKVTEYGFKQERLGRIFAPVITYNKASAKVLEKAGFEKEGVMKNQFLKNGNYVDAYLFAKVNK